MIKKSNLGQLQEIYPLGIERKEFGQRNLTQEMRTT